MAVYLSLFAGAGQQFFTNAGVPLAGGKIYTYGAGGSTPQATYTTSAGNIAHSNPIVLDAAGRVPGGGEIWLTEGLAYKFVLQTSANVTVQTLDNVSGGNDPSAILATLAASNGSSLIGFIQAGTGAVARTVQSKLRESVSVLDFGADPTGVADSTIAIQNACNYAASNSRKTVYVPSGNYKVSSTIYSRNTNVTNGTTGCGIVGDGPFSTVFVPDGDFTVINFVSSYLPCGGFSIAWPLTAKASIPNTRIGVEFCDGYNQVSQTKIQDIIVLYAYNSFLQRDWTGSPGGLGTMYVVDFERLISFRAADYGFKFSAVNNGSTTHRFSTCWANASASTGSYGGMGFYMSGINDLLFENCAVDFCQDIAWNLQSGNQANLISCALESCFSLTDGTPLIQFTAISVANVVGMKEIACTINIPGVSKKAYGIFAGSSCICNVSGYARQALTSTAGTLYKVGLNSESARISVDRSVLFSEAFDNGWFTMIYYYGNRYSSTGGIPTQGNNVQGEIVKNMAPAIGQPKGWVCTVSGSPGTWVSEGNL